MIDTSPAAPRIKPPNYWLGFFLNWLLIGAGFSYIGVFGWHLAWLGIWVGGLIVSAVLVLVTPVAAGVGLLLMLGAFVGLLVHYRSTYARLYGPGQSGPRSVMACAGA